MAQSDPRGLDNSNTHIQEEAGTRMSYISTYIHRFRQATNGCSEATLAGAGGFCASVQAHIA